MKHRNDSGALVVEEYIYQNITALTADYKNEFDDEDKFQLYLNERLLVLNGLKNAIECNGVNVLDKIVHTNINNTKTLLKDYGYKF